ncbi:hypothetical protein LCGC14_2823470 [marine sediment metagenome]|uniref:CoA transferase n=1 Tax=marine sediment metagenome TaxID=412755 RepID=A0A0F9B7G9_9ZZZZ
MAGPLSGIRVADFTWVWAGPFCTMQFAHMGAEVLRVETMRRVCALRMLPPWLDGPKVRAEAKRRGVSEKVAREVMRVKGKK